MGSMADRSPHRPGRRTAGLALLVVVAVVIAGVSVVLARRPGGSGEMAAANGAPQAGSTTTSPGTRSTSPTSTTEAPLITKLASPDHPAAVGVTTLTLTDLTRGTASRGERPALSDRPLQVTVRYPTAGLPSEIEYDGAKGYAPAPLILFAHGFDISADRYSALTHDLASFGFVVVSPEFPMSSTVFDGAPDEYDIPEQARDLSFLITALTGPDAPAQLAGLIAPGPVGLIGHSDGAVTVLLTGYAPRFADPRVGAVIAVSGDFDTFGGSWFTTNDPPLIAVHGEWDEINPFWSSQELYDNDPGWVMLVGVQSSTHLAAIVEPANERAIARLAGFDFLWRLTGSSSAEISTYQAADTPPLELVDSHE